VRARFESVQREFEALATTRRRQLERPLQELEALRVERGLPVAAFDSGSELSGADVLELPDRELQSYRGMGA